MNGQQDKQRAIEALERAGYHFHKTLKIYVGPNGCPIVGVEDKYFEATGPVTSLTALLAPGYTADQVEEAVVKVRAAIDDRKNGWGKAGSEAGHQALNMLLRTLYAPPTDANPG